MQSDETHSIQYAPLWPMHGAVLPSERYSALQAQEAIEMSLSLSEQICVRAQQYPESLLWHLKRLGPTAVLQDLPLVQTLLPQYLVQPPLTRPGLHQYR